MRSLRMFFVVALASFTLLLTSGVSRADTLSDIKQAKKIRISIDLTNSPYGKTDDKMQPSGSDVDIAKLLAKDLGVEFEIVPTTGSSRIPNLADRQGGHRYLLAVDHARARQGDRFFCSLRGSAVGGGGAEKHQRQILGGS